VAIGQAIQVRANVRAEFGLTKIIQGASAIISDGDTDTVRQFIGQQSSAELHPSYHIPPAYNTLDGRQDYNGLESDDLTVRVSKLTAMMADKAQDKTITKGFTGCSIVSNTASGLNRSIAFIGPAPLLNIIMPSSA